MRYHKLLYSHIWRMVRDQQEAEDLTQTVFIQFHHHYDAIEEEKVKGWLYRVATRLGLNAIRDRQRYQNAQKNVSKQHELIEHKPKQPVEELLRTEQQLRVQAVLSRLSERDGRLLFFYYAGLKNYTELATELQLNPKSVGKMLARAKLAFKKAYQAELEKEKKGEDCAL